MNSGLLIVEIGLDATNDHIYDQMRIMKRCRENDEYGSVICCIRGFDEDHRELYDIPEVRAFCRRLFNLGFTSYLNFSTFLEPIFSSGPKAWAALEVWMCSEGMANAPITKELCERFSKLWMESNQRADDAIGAFVNN